MSSGDSTELSGVGVRRGTNVLAHQWNGLSGQSAEELDEKDGNMQKMRGVPICALMECGGIPQKAGGFDPPAAC